MSGVVVKAAVDDLAPISLLHGVVVPCPTEAVVVEEAVLRAVELL